MVYTLSRSDSRLRAYQRFLYNRYVNPLLKINQISTSSVAVIINASQALDPGSTPGWCRSFCSTMLFWKRELEKCRDGFVLVNEALTRKLTSEPGGLWVALRYAVVSAGPALNPLGRAVLLLAL